jgi:hypothetical protein
VIDSLKGDWLLPYAKSDAELTLKLYERIEHERPIDTAGVEVGAPRPFVVIGCGKQKRADRSPACDLYTGSLFVAARRYAEASGVPWAILSAEHGLVLPTDELDPYDRKLRLKGAELTGWARRAAWRCMELVRALPVPPSSAEVLAGHPYAWPFRNELLWAPGGGMESTEPLEGLGLGHRLQWLKNAREALEGGR